MNDTHTYTHPFRPGDVVVQNVQPLKGDLMIIDSAHCDVIYARKPGSAPTGPHHPGHFRIARSADVWEWLGRMLDFATERELSDLFSCYGLPVLVTRLRIDNEVSDQLYKLQTRVEVLEKEIEILVKRK